ncbi:nascent polypeptide-associated complex subunit alpha, muscle-specific form-like isoform X3 [Asterias rubens]|uniref:nascent polypeptide-associated complex subunit alpha, muscle-specific form-like isoform X3 n=1 Tax=Asterias rubens TaxID=7604 RepID=UPI0014551944|nr:nascent polypeptide-associated complex subunit alpha, muscle-specific form-like isoform X3 [Asterias rubens]
MDSLAFSQTDLGTQGDGPCFMVMNSQLEHSEDVPDMKDVILRNAETSGPYKQRMLWELTALRGTQPSPVLVTGRVPEEKSYFGKTNVDVRTDEVTVRTKPRSQPTDQQQNPASNHVSPDQGDAQQENAAGDQGGDAAGGGGEGAAGGAGGAGGGDDGNGGQGGDRVEEEDEEEHEETGEETSQDTNSSNSPVPKLVAAPVLNTPPRTVRVKEILQEESPAVSSDPQQSEEDPGPGSERGGAVSDAPTAVVGDSNEEDQGAVTSPSPPREEPRPPGELPIMDPPVRIPKKRTSDSHSSSLSSNSGSHHSSSYLASHDSASSSLLSSLTSSSSCSSSGLQATSSLKFTHIKDHPSKSSISPSLRQDVDSLRQDEDGDAERDYPQSSQQDLFSEVTEERKADYNQLILHPHYHGVRVLANETSTSDDASVNLVPPTPEAFKYGIQETPPYKNEDVLGGGYHSEQYVHRPAGESVLVNETSTSDDASITIVQPSPEAWGTVIANTPPDKIEQYSRSTHSSAAPTSRGDSDHSPSTPSVTLGSLHLSGQQALSQDSIGSIVPPTLGAYGPVPGLIPSTPTQQDEEEPMELSLQDDDADDAMTTHAPKAHKSTRQEADDDEDGIPKWQQVLNQEELLAKSRSSSRSSNRTSLSQQSSESSSGRSSAVWKGQQSESFQAWQPSAQVTTSATSDENPRSRPPSTTVGRTTEESDTARRKKQDQGDIADKPRSASALDRRLEKEPHVQKQKSQSQPEAPLTIPQLQDEKPPCKALERSVRPSMPQSHQDPSNTKTASKQNVEKVSSSQEEKMQTDQRGSGRRGSSDEWLLHYTPTQTETETDAEEQTRKRFRQPAHPTQQPEAAPSTSRHPQDPVAVLKTSEVATHTLMSFTDTASSDAKKNTHAAASQAVDEQRMKSPSGDDKLKQDPQSKGGSMPGVMSQSTDATEYSSIDFHLSLPMDGGFRPIGGPTLPSMVSREKRMSSRPPVRHSTPIMDEDESLDRDPALRRADAPAEHQANLHDGKEAPPRLVKTGTLTLCTDPDTQESTQMPDFQLARPEDSNKMLKAAYESPSKKSTSVFSKVQATKTAASPPKVKGRPSLTAKCSESDDLFVFSQKAPKKSYKEPEAAVLEGQKELEDEDDEETIPFSFLEKEDDNVEMIQGGRKGADQRTARGQEKQKPRRETSRRGPEKTPEKPRTPSSNRLTRSGRKRTVPEGKPEEKGQPKRTTKRAKFADEVVESRRTSSAGRRDPYDFSDSQSNKTPSPMKKTAGQPTSTKEKPTPQSSLSRRAQPQIEPKPKHRVEFDTTATASSPGMPPKTVTPVRGKGQASKSTPATRTPSARGRRTPSSRGKRTPTSRARHASPQVQAQLADESSPEITTEKPVREKEGVKFRKSPRKRPPKEPVKSPEDKPSENPPPPQKTITRHTIVGIYRRTRVELHSDGKVIKSWETEKQMEPPVETVEEEESLDTPSPARSGSSLTSGSLGDISSLYSKTSSSTPSLAKSLSGSTLSKQSSFSSISRTSSKMGSPGSDKSTPSLTRSLSSPASDKSIGKKGEKVSPSSPRRVSLTRSKTHPATRSSSSSDGEARSTKTIFQKPQQTPRRKINQQQSSDFAKRLSVTAPEDSRSPEERSPQRERIPAATVVKLVQSSQPDVTLEKENEEDQSPKLETRTSRRQTRGDTSSLSPAPVASPSGRTDSKPREKVVSTPDSTRSSPRRKVTSASRKTSPSPSSQKRQSTPPQQSTRPLTSEPSTSQPLETLHEPPPGETLPVVEGDVALLLPGLKVYTKWLDGFWYPGTILHQERLSRYLIEFDDGDHRSVNEADIIIKEWLSRGQTVMAEDRDGYYYAGTVVGYYKDPDKGTSGYVIEQTVSRETSRYERQRVILTKDQAASLVSSASNSSSTSGNNVISLDNVVYNKRTRVRSRLLDTPGSSKAEKLKQQSPQQPEKTTPSRQAVKRKLVASEEQGRKGTPSPRKRGRPAKKAAATAAALPSPDLTTSPRRSPRKHQQQENQPAAGSPPIAVHMGGVPKLTTLFRNHAFLVTHGEVKRQTLKEKSSSDSTDGSSGDDEVETVPFDRAYAITQIQSGGGLVLSDFNKSQITKMKVLLISNTHCRTKKYFQALAAGIPCISHLWLRDCCKTERLQNHKNYLLPAGDSIEENTLMEIQPNRSILAGMSIYMVSDYEGVQNSWRSILIAAGCHIVSKIPSHLDFTKNPDLCLDCDVIVTDPSCPRSLLHRAHSLKIPMVSCEWVIQCLINGVRVPYRGHAKYEWNYREKPPR